jgi:acid stress-induced BolA-like protein IbaG/YrbA
MQDLSVPCRADLLNKKIMVVIGERLSNGVVEAHQQNYGPHYQAINKRLKALGLRTYTPEEIRRQIAQAELDAYFRNDPDAALAASRRLGASFVLRGLITSQAMRNPMMAVNQVSVNMGFTLTGSNGRLISDTEASSSSYAGADVSSMALTLVNEKADEVVAKLYADYCQNAAHPK